MDKNIKYTPKMGVFPHLWPPKIFFQKSGSVTFVPLWCPNFMQKIRKKQWTVSEIFKDRRMDQRTRAITKDPLGWTRGPKLEKTNGQTLEIFKDGRTTDQWTNGQTRAITNDPLEEPRVQNSFSELCFTFHTDYSFFKKFVDMMHKEKV